MAGQAALLDGIGAPGSPGLSPRCPSAGVAEIRPHTALEHRVLYVTKFEEAVYVLHAFEKRTPKTSAADIALARKRLDELRQLRTRLRKP